jgi:eukaryotic-like serine/threonine-protein kinase
MTTQPGGLNGSKRTTTKPLDAPQMLVGRVLEGRYRLDGILSSGGMGIIFRATQLSVNRQVAVKVLKPTLAAELDLARRFSQEVELGARFCHPNIINLIDAGRDAGGLVYLVMEFFEGETLREALQSAALTLPEILEVFAQVCDALTESHGSGVIHRDIKFDNVMLRRLRDGRIHVKLLDFGVAKLLGNTAELTRNGQTPGTPGIIAPELVDMHEPTPRSDLYSMGVLLFTVLCGRAPFQGINDLELMRAHRNEPVPSIRAEVLPEVPDSLLELVYALMAKEPDGRPESAQEVHNRLQVIAQECIAASPDAARYQPPINRYPERAPDLSLSTMEREAFGVSSRVERARRDEEIPILVPTSVVAMLSVVLMVCLMIIFVLIRELVRS